MLGGTRPRSRLERRPEPVPHHRTRKTWWWRARTCREQFDYVALGHIHKPQALGAKHVRYCGSIERMDLGEQADQKGVVLFEIGPDGRKGEPVVLPLPSTPIYEVVVLNPAEDLPRLEARVSRTRRPTS